ncbi:hypothetical protein RhiirC2_801830 [Rhizophagus irregularis]|uniref:Uncharacterized protein n=1 Tax=Rhizophagus irregularis TaxID=588596 RepID=A0A2N1M1Y6_9GLOM|nr:hypothetical protein RhiirC2_801830 [Rhizophagus irregularis]
MDLLLESIGKFIAFITGSSLDQANKALENATEEFVWQIDEKLKRINSVLKVKVDYIITEKAKKEFTEAVSCWICNGNFNQDKKVWDHCHITGKFCVAAYSACNLKL